MDEKTANPFYLEISKGNLNKILKDARQKTNRIKINNKSCVISLKESDSNPKQMEIIEVII
jgi:predicted DNA-binding protein (UPF0251 family)